MKKLMFALVAAGAAAVMADAIESQNIVGYNTITIADTSAKDQFYIAGCQFKDANSAGQTIAVSDLVKFTGVTPGTAKTKSTAAPQLQVWDPAANGYLLKYYYVSDATLQAGGTGIGWIPAAGKIETTDTVALGTAFWLKLPKNSANGGTGTATFAGEVLTSAKTKTFTIGKDNEYYLIINPFPVALTIDMVTASGLVPATVKTKTLAPQIQVWDQAAEGYTKKFYYVSDAALIAGGTGTAWIPSAGKNEATGTIADVGCGFWVKSSAEATLTITIP